MSHYQSLYLWVIALLVLAGCHTSPVLPAGSRAQQEEDIQEAVLVHLIKPSQQGAEVIFVSIKNRDATSQFLQRLRTNHQLNAKPASASSFARGFIQDPATGIAASKYEVEDIKWLNVTSAKVSAGSSQSNLSAFGCKYLVKWDGTQWRVGEGADCYVA